jgi:hypothetical protein
MVDYITDEKDTRTREKMRPIFWILPLILSSLVVLLLIIIRAVKGKAGISWGGIVLWCLFTEVVVWGISMMIYGLTSMKEVKSKEREFNSPQRCDELLREYIMKDTGFVLEDFSKTAESVYGSRWAGEGTASEQERIYFHLYRIRVNALFRYLLCVINMDKSKADSYIIHQSPSNFTNINKEVDEMSDQLCSRRKKMITRERVYRDEVAGRSETVKEESPLDSSENEDDVDES